MALDEQERDELKAKLHKKFNEWQKIGDKTGVSFTESLLAKRDFHNPNMAEFLGRLGGLNEFGTNFPGNLDVIRGDDVPDFDKMGMEQREDWERSQQPKPARTNIPFVTSSRPSSTGPTSYAALLQERRNQQPRK